MEHQCTLTTALVCLGMDFISLLFLFYGKFTHFWVRATFESLRLISWTSLLFTAWSNMSQHCFIGFRYGKYASQGKTLISRFSRKCWNFHGLWARTLLCSDKKFKPKCFPAFGTISSFSKSWYEAVLTFLVRTTKHLLALTVGYTWNMNLSIIMGLYWICICLCRKCG